MLIIRNCKTKTNTSRKASPVPPKNAAKIKESDRLRNKTKRTTLKENSEK